MKVKCKIRDVTDCHAHLFLFARVDQTLILVVELPSSPFSYNSFLPIPVLPSLSCKSLDPLRSLFSSSLKLILLSQFLSNPPGRRSLSVTFSITLHLYLDNNLHLLFI